MMPATPTSMASLTSSNSDERRDLPATKETSTNSNQLRTNNHSAQQISKDFDESHNHDAINKEDEDDGDDSDAVWTREIHESFVRAIHEFGIKHSSPSIIIENMTSTKTSPSNANAVTSERVKSHLQKYRSKENREKSINEFMESYGNWMEFADQQGRPPTRRADGSVLSGGENAALLSYMTMVEDRDRLQDGQDQRVQESSSLPLSFQEKTSKTTQLDGAAAATQFLTKQGKQNYEVFASSTNGEMLFPQLTEEEKQTPLGESLCYVMALVSSMSRTVKKNRGETLSTRSDFLPSRVESPKLSESFSGKEESHSCFGTRKAPLSHQDTAKQSSLFSFLQKEDHQEEATQQDIKSDMLVNTTSIAQGNSRMVHIAPNTKTTKINPSSSKRKVLTATSTSLPKNKTRRISSSDSFQGMIGSLDMEPITIINTLSTCNSPLSQTFEDTAPTIVSAENSYVDSLCTASPPMSSTRTSMPSRNSRKTNTATRDDGFGNNSINHPSENCTVSAGPLSDAWQPHASPPPIPLYLSSKDQRHHHQQEPHRYAECHHSNHQITTSHNYDGHQARAPPTFVHTMPQNHHPPLYHHHNMPPYNRPPDLYHHNFYIPPPNSTATNTNTYNSSRCRHHQQKQQCNYK